MNKVNDALRAIEPNIWLRVAMDDIRETNGLLIDGIRFKSNLDFCRERGFKLVRIDATLSTRMRRLKARGQEFNVESDANHAGETELQDETFDHVIRNDQDDSVAFRQQLDTIVARGQSA